MKYSKSAMRAHHVQLGHMSMMQPTRYGDPVDEAPAPRPRIYSTERYAPPSTNGISVPRQLRDRIEAAMVAPSNENVETTSPSLLSSRWGFL